MKEINLGAIVTAKRRERGITQEELAAHMGVSKASVSKWETGQSYPDITLLPQLAAYFDVSIDYLVGYTPQLGVKEIKKLYQRLASDFATKDFSEVVAECERLTKKFYSCYPLLLHITLLYINHAPLTNDSERSRQILVGAVQLCEHVKQNSRDAHLIREAVLYQALCHLSLGEGEEVLGLLGRSVRLETKDGPLIAQAYMLAGESEKSQEILQVDLYQNLMSTFQSLLSILQNNLHCLSTAERVFSRAEGLAKLFDMNRLSPNNMAVLYALGAHMYQIAGDSASALDLLAKYVDTCIYDFFPIKLRGDDFFSKIDGWLSDNADVVPRSESVVKDSMMKDVLHSPVFAPLWENPEYRLIVERLKAFIQGGN